MRMRSAVAALTLGAAFDANALSPGVLRSAGIWRPPVVSRRSSRIQMATPINHRLKRWSRRKDTNTQAVSIPVVDQEISLTGNDEPFDYGAKPPFTLADIRAAIPEKCFKKNTRRSLAYLARDILAVVALGAGALAIRHPLLWPLYWLAQGTIFWALFVVGHDCGHGSFSTSRTLNDIVGHLTHSFILVPYHGWRISHRTHHANHGHVENDESWTPPTRTVVKRMDSSARLGRFNKWVMLIVYPFYLYLRSPGKSGSHFNPKSPLFVPSEKKEVLTSTACYATMVAILAGVGIKFGLPFLLKMYFVPYWIFVMWLDVVTYLHHTDKEVPWFRGDSWSYLRGGLSTRDHDYGIINDIHHNIGTHVVHHLFPQMPHYHIVEATEAVKPVLGKYFKEPEKSGVLPFHLIKQYLKGTEGNLSPQVVVGDRKDIIMHGTGAPRVFRIKCNHFSYNLGYSEQFAFDRGHSPSPARNAFLLKTRAKLYTTNPNRRCSSDPLFQL